MHEFAIAQQLIEAAESALADHTAPIKRVRVQLGPLASVSKEELDFGFSVVAANTPHAGAVLEIDEILAIVHCRACGLESILGEPDVLLCPACGEATVRVIQGKELTLMSVEFESIDIELLDVESIDTESIETESIEVGNGVATA